MWTRCGRGGSYGQAPPTDRCLRLRAGVDIGRGGWSAGLAGGSAHDRIRRVDRTDLSRSGRDLGHRHAVRLPLRHADIGYLMVGVEGATIRADPKLRLVRVIPSAVWWLEFPEQWNPKSPWRDRRVRLAANLAVDKHAINDAERLGFSRLTGSIIPSVMEFALKIEPFGYDPTHAKRLLADAGYPNGFDAGDLTPLPPFTTMGEAVANDLAAVGIRSRVRIMERAAYMEAGRAQKLQGVLL